MLIKIKLLLDMGFGKKSCVGGWLGGFRSGFKDFLQQSIKVQILTGWGKYCF